MVKCKVESKKKKRKPKSDRTKKAEELWEVIKTYIRMRDKNICQKSGDYVEGVNCHVSHVIPKSHGNALRYDEINLKVLSYHNHINWWHKNPTESGEWFKKKFPERYKYLEENKNKIVKLRISDLQDLIEEYTDKIIGLEMQEEL